MYLIQKKELVGEKPSRLQLKQTCRSAYEASQADSFEVVDLTQTETFKTLFKQARRLRNNTVQ